jgi:ABC-type Fe3+-hydroxamate transport system substrate-binding protein
MQRIISLVPSQTEFLYDIGLEEEVVGITKFCIHPQSWFRTKTRVGGTKQLKLDLIRQLQPDLILANKEENVKEQVEELSKEFNVWTSDIHHLEDAYMMMTTIGEMTDKLDAAKKIIAQIQENFAELQTLNLSSAAMAKVDISHRTLYLIWQKPYMSVGGDTFISSMMEAAGFENCCKDKTRYPGISIADIRELAPDLIFLSSEPFPFQEKHVHELEQLELPARIMLVDGEMFSWYGSRLLHAPAYFKHLLSII